MARVPVLGVAGVPPAGHDPAQPVVPHAQGGGEQVVRGAKVVGAQHQPGDVAVGELDRPGVGAAPGQDGAGRLLRLHGITFTVPGSRAGAERSFFGNVGNVGKR